MPDPLLSLVVAAALGGALALCFWPERGLFWRWQRTRQMTERVRIEDGLKHLYEAQLAGQCAPRASLAAALHISEGQTVELLAKMAERKLLELGPDSICLTATGTEHALHIIRAHRLWERHLAEETGYREDEWHRRAHEAEHRLTAADLEALAARLNHPTHDPHGDPIPTAAGEIEHHAPRLLTDLVVGAAARIVHLEDEPITVYAQLVAEGLAPGVTVRVLEATPQRIRFWADSDEHVLAPLLARNISVEPLAVRESSTPVRPVQRLTSLKPGQQATVAAIAPACRGVERRRFLDLGILPGTQIEAALASPSGNPVAYRIRGSLIALRHEQAEHIQITHLPERIQEVPA
jgi:DtxR family Mn-dependent transcriptional regulator